MNQVGNSGMRSYRLGRFTGDQALRASADILYQFKPLKTAIFPIRSNIFAGYDVGRVWLNEESSKVWHDSYGGGLNFSMGGIWPFAKSPALRTSRITAPVSFAAVSKASDDKACVPRSKTWSISS